MIPYLLFGGVLALALAWLVGFVLAVLAVKREAEAEVRREQGS